jgi:hypothetical protein
LKKHLWHMEHELRQRLILFTVCGSITWGSRILARCAKGQVNRIVVDGWLGSC